MTKIDKPKAFMLRKKDPIWKLFSDDWLMRDEDGNLVLNSNKKAIIEFFVESEYNSECFSAKSSIPIPIREA